MLLHNKLQGQSKLKIDLQFTNENQHWVTQEDIAVGVQIIPSF